MGYWLLYVASWLNTPTEVYAILFLRRSQLFVSIVNDLARFIPYFCCCNILAYFSVKCAYILKLSPHIFKGPHRSYWALPNMPPLKCPYANGTHTCTHACVSDTIVAWYIKHNHKLQFNENNNRQNNKSIIALDTQTGERETEALLVIVNGMSVLCNSTLSVTFIGPLGENLFAGVCGSFDVR